MSHFLSSITLAHRFCKLIRSSYCSANKLSVNFKKTHYMTISSPQKANKLKLNLRNIEEKNYIKYLGIYIDKNLNWAPHIQHINSKISKNLGILFRLRHFLTLNTLKQIYYSLIYPFLHYGIMSWGNTYPSRLTKVQTKQNKCIRCIFFSHNRESSAPYLKLLDIFNIELTKSHKMKPISLKCFKTAS